MGRLGFRGILRGSLAFLVLVGAGWFVSQSGAHKGGASRPAAAAVSHVAAPTSSPTQPENLNVTQTVKGAVVSASGSAVLAKEPAQAVAFSDGEHGWALVGCGAAPASSPGGSNTNACHVVATTNGGKTWSVAWTASRNFDRLDAVNPHVVFAWQDANLMPCPHGHCAAAVAASTDGGAHWALQYSGPLAFTGLTFPSATKAFGVAGGVLYASDDAGATWTAVVKNSACQLQSVSVVGAVGSVVGQGAQGTCGFRTTSGGAAWSPWIAGVGTGALSGPFHAMIQASGFAKFIGGPALQEKACSQTAVQVEGPQGAWLTVLCNNINPDMLGVFHTTDGGARWQLAWSTSGCAMGCAGQGESESPLFFLGNVVWRTEPGGVAESPDGGAAWTSGGQLCAQMQCVPNLDFLSATTGFAATANGVFATTSGGAAWHRIWPVAGPGPLAAVSLLPHGVGFAVPRTAAATIWETQDGGGHWRLAIAAPSGVHLSALDFVSPSVGYVFGNGAIYVTRDAGARFQRVPLPSGVNGNVQLHFSSVSQGALVDAAGHAWTTQDGGASWIRQTVPALGLVQAEAWSPSGTLYATVFHKLVPGHFGLVRSTDGGLHWTALAVWPWPPGPGAFNSGVFAVQGGDVWTFAEQGLMHSTNGGKTWTEVALPTSRIFPTELVFAGLHNGWLLTAAGMLYATQDAGRTWQETALSRGG